MKFVFHDATGRIVVVGEHGGRAPTPPVGLIYFAGEGRLGIDWVDPNGGGAGIPAIVEMDGCDGVVSPLAISKGGTVAVTANESGMTLTIRNAQIPLLTFADVTNGPLALGAIGTFEFRFTKPLRQDAVYSVEVS